MCECRGSLGLFFLVFGNCYATWIDLRIYTVSKSYTLMKGNEYSWHDEVWDSPYTT